MSPGPIVDTTTDGIAEQQPPSVDATSLKKAPLPQEENGAPIVEDDHDEDEKDESDDEEENAAQGGTDGSKQSRSEKKSRKAMLKLGLMSSRVQILRPMLYLGRQKIEDLSSQLQTQAVQRFRMPDMGSIMAKQEHGAIADGVQREKEERRRRRKPTRQRQPRTTTFQRCSSGNTSKKPNLFAAISLTQKTSRRRCHLTNSHPHPTLPIPPLAA